MRGVCTLQFHFRYLFVHSESIAACLETPPLKLPLKLFRPRPLVTSGLLKPMANFQPYFPWPSFPRGLGDAATVELLRSVALAILLCRARPVAVLGCFSIPSVPICLSCLFSFSPCSLRELIHSLAPSLLYSWLPSLFYVTCILPIYLDFQGNTHPLILQPPKMTLKGIVFFKVSRTNLQLSATVTKFLATYLPLHFFQSVHLPMDTWMVSILWLLWITLQWIWEWL